MKRAEYATAIIAFLSRWIVGFLFLMPGWTKMFTMGPIAFARRVFVEGYAETWIPKVLLWIAGLPVPFIELIGGFLLILGLWTQRVCLLLGLLLVMVNYGHLLKDPFYDVTTHVMPRLLLLFIILIIPPEEDRFSLHALWKRWRTRVS